MDVEGGRLDRILAFDDVAVAVGHDDVGRRDLRPVQPLRIDQEQLLAAGHRHAEMVADALVQPVARGRAERRRQVDARLGYGVVGQHRKSSVAERSRRGDDAAKLCRGQAKSPRPGRRRMNVLFALAAGRSAGQDHGSTRWALPGCGAGICRCRACGRRPMPPATTQARFRDEIGAPLPAFWSAARLRAPAGSQCPACRRAPTRRVLRGRRRSSTKRRPVRSRPTRPAVVARRRRAIWRPAGVLSAAVSAPAPAARWRIDRARAGRARAWPACSRSRPSLRRAGRCRSRSSVSPPFVRSGLREYWLRAPTPAARLRERPGSERLYARVVEPADGAPQDTLIFGSGLCLEFELLSVAQRSRRPSGRDGLAGDRAGLAVSRPAGEPGRYGGEPFFAAGPTSSIDLIAGQAIEIGAARRLVPRRASAARWRWPAFR